MKTSSGLAAIGPGRAGGALAIAAQVMENCFRPAATVSPALARQYRGLGQMAASRFGADEIDQYLESPHRP